MKDGQLDFTTSKIVANPSEAGKIKAAYEAIKAWKDFSLSGTNELKQLIGDLRKFADEAGIPSKSPFLGSYYRKLDGAIKKALPKEARSKYEEINKVFSDNIELYDDMVQAFNSGDPFTKIAGALGKNRDTLRQTLDAYEKASGEKILPIVAGRELGMEKNAAFGLMNPRSWIDLLFSPQAQAKMITGIGKMKK